MGVNDRCASECLFYFASLTCRPDDALHMFLGEPSFVRTRCLHGTLRSIASEPGILFCRDATRWCISVADNIMVERKRVRFRALRA